jgi:hypothetical protein
LTPDFAQSPRGRALEIGSASGHTNAFGLAKIAAVIANGGEINGVRLISNEGLKVALDKETTKFMHGISREVPISQGGYGNFGDGLKGWGGWGGSQIFFSDLYNISLGYTITGMGAGATGDPERMKFIIMELMKAVMAEKQQQGMGSNNSKL